MGLCDRDVTIEIDAGQEFVEHVEASAPMVCLFGGSDLGAGRSFVVESTVGLEAQQRPEGLDGLDAPSASVRFAFARPGLYRIRARHGDAVSNVITVDAVALNAPPNRSGRGCARPRGSATIERCSGPTSTSTPGIPATTTICRS